MEKILIIGTVWPEPNSSAAGTRMLQIIDVFLSEKWDITFASTAKKSEYSFPLENRGVKMQEIELNHSSFDEFVSELSPSIVMFDRFMIEEQFGWRTQEFCPNALKVLDTEDLHCLRRSREKAFKDGIEFDSDMLLNNDTSKREIASILRCDLSLIISSFEMSILTNVFRIDENLLLYLPFLLEKERAKNTPFFSERKHFITIGNFLHPPNWDSVQYLKKEIWHLIRKQLPEAQMHVYGSYTSEKVSQLNNEKEGFLIKGRAENVIEVMSNAKICLAPLRFGAGLKGKLIDAMENGTTSVTTSIGAEGMQNGLDWNGFVSNDSKEFAQKSVDLYQDEKLWNESSKQGYELLKQFSKEEHQVNLIEKIKSLKLNLNQHRSQNFIGSLLNHHSMQSTKYMSRWIEEKNKKSSC